METLARSGSDVTWLAAALLEQVIDTWLNIT